MSTKIHNGYRILKTDDLPAFTRKITEKITPVYQQLALRAVSLMALGLVWNAIFTEEKPFLVKSPTSVDLKDWNAINNFIKQLPADLLEISNLLYDNEKFNGLEFSHKLNDLSSRQSLKTFTNGTVKPEDLYYSFNVWEQAALIVRIAQENLQKTLAKRIPSTIDLQMSAVFMSNPNNTKDPYTYVLLYTDRQDFLDIWEALPEVDSFTYWNNYDPPREVTEEEWENRGEIWNQIIGNKTPAECGIIWKYPDERLDFEALISYPRAWLTIENGLDCIQGWAKDQQGFSKIRDKLKNAFASSPIVFDK